MLFILSTVVVGVGSEYYKGWKEKQEEKKLDFVQIRKDQVHVQRLKNELIVRNKTLEALLDSIPAYQKKDCELAFLGGSIRNAVNADYYNFKPLYAQFELMSLFEIIVQYKDYINKNGESTKQIQDCIELIMNERQELIRSVRVFDKGRDGGIYPPTEPEVQKGVTYYVYSANGIKRPAPKESLPLTPYYSVLPSSRKNLEELIDLLGQL
jgi:hypothetical protein